MATRRPRRNRSVTKRVDRAAWISASGAVLAALVAIPGGIYSARQLHEIRESADSAAESLKQAKRLSAAAEASLAVAHQIANAATIQASEAQKSTTAAERQSANSTILASRAGDQVVAAGRSAQASEQLADAAKEQLAFARESTDVQLFVTSMTPTVIKMGDRLYWNIEIGNRGSHTPSMVKMWSHTGLRSPADPPVSVPDCYDSWKPLEFGTGSFSL